MLLRKIPPENTGIKRILFLSPQKRFLSNRNYQPRRLGGLEEEMNDDRDGKIEGDQNDNSKNYGGKTEDRVKKVGGKVVGGIINKSKEEEEDDNEGPQKHCWNGKK